MRDSGSSRRGKRFLFVVRARYITIPLCETATLTFNIRQSAPPPRKEGKSGGLFHFSGSERTRRQPATMPTAQINNPTICNHGLQRESIRIIGLGLSDERSRVLSSKSTTKSRILKEDYGRFSWTSSLFSLPLCYSQTKSPERCPFCYRTDFLPLECRYPPG